MMNQMQKQSFTKYELKRRKEIVFDFVSKISIKPDHTALDLGCGAGQYLLGLADIGFKCTGADISEDMLQITSSKLEKASLQNTKLLCADCYDVPLPSNSFDLIICIGVLEYLDKESSALAEINRLVKYDGNVIVTFPNFYKLRNLLNPYYYVIRIWTYMFGKKPIVPKSDNVKNKDVKINFGKSTVTRYSLIKVKQIIEGSGFKINESRGYCFGPFSIWKKDLFSLKTSIKISDFIESLLRYRLFGFLSFFANRWVIHIQPLKTSGVKQ